MRGERRGRGGPETDETNEAAAAFGRGLDPSGGVDSGRPRWMSRYLTITIIMGHASFGNLLRCNA